MTTRVLEGFALALPEGFAEQPDAGGAAFRSPAGEQIAFSAAAVTAPGPEAQQRMVRDRLVQGALKDVQRAVCQPDLEVIVPLTHAPGGDPAVETWNLVARSGAGRLFAQAVVATEGAVAILTFDGRNAPASIERWFAVLESVRPA